MAKIAVASGDRPVVVDGPNPPKARLLAKGEGWAISDVVCTAGPRNRPFEECHPGPSIAVVVAGTFQYRSSSGCDLMTPGSILLGNTGDCFRCGHEHGTGDRCVSFSYAPEFFERLAADAGVAKVRFKIPRLAPARILSPLVARAAAALRGVNRMTCDELSIHVATQVVRLERGIASHGSLPEAGALARVTRVVRTMESQPDGPHDLVSLARMARLSPFHFLRTFQAVTGVTPHQYLLRMRLREAAIRLSVERAKILDIALDCGFGDVSNFNRAFRAEFGVSPRVYRARVT